MSFDLTQLLQNTIAEPLTNYVTEQLGESSDIAAKGVSMAIPALLGGLLKNSGDNNKMTELFNTITGPNISSEVSQVAPNMLEQGRGLLDTLLGGTDDLSNLLSSKTGMSAGNIGSMLTAALPMLLGTLRSHVQSENLTQPQFVSLLDEQKGFLAKLLDGDFIGALGLGALGMAVGGAVTGAVSGAADVAEGTVSAVTDAVSGVADAAGGAVSAATDAVSGAVDAAEETVAAVTDTVSDVVAPVAGGMSSWGVLIASAIATVLLASFCTGKSPAPSGSTSADTAGKTEAPAAAEPATPSADTTSTAAANDATNTASTDANAADDASVRYADGVLSVFFDTGKTDFDTNLAQTLATEIVEMGKSGKKLAVSGYNDPTGNAKLNAELSKNRAKSVRDFLVAQGVPADNVELVKPEETTGDSGSNSQDRRVDVRVQP